MNKIFYLILFFNPFFSYSQPSILRDPTTADLIKECVQHIYNSDLEQSNKLAEKVGKILPEHPAYPMLKALALRWAHEPVDIQGDIYPEIKKYLNQTQELSTKFLDKHPNDPEVKFISLAAHSLQAMFYGDEGSYLKAVGEAKDAYGYIKEGFDLKEKYPEFYFPVGLYNYYREAYPEKHPVYKPFMFFFKKGDKELGLEQLQIAREKSVFMKAEAGLYLVHLNLRYELKPSKAVKFANLLIQDYPENLLFRTYCIESLLETGNFSEAKQLNDILLNNSRVYYKTAGQVFQGIIQEKYFKDKKEAKKLYDLALETGKALEIDNALNIKSMAYAGLARLADQNGNTRKAKTLYKQCLELAQYANTSAEAHNYLNNN